MDACHDTKEGKRLQIGSDVVVTIAEVNGGSVRVVIEAQCYRDTVGLRHQ